MSTMFNIPEPASANEIVATLERVQEESVAYWSAFDTAAFFARIDGHWSPAENVRHLIKSIRPVTKALGLPRLVLRFMFGNPRRNSERWSDVQTRYLGLLDAGGNAGRFAPSEREETDLEAGRARIMGQFVQANRDLRAAITKWPDRSLDRYQLPHPLLGKLTLREMLIFTAYHQTHHLDGVKRRLH
ncbi:MAG: DinB family protein [Acidobacteriota bacterium]|nr:DinB family protein [Acidobacteriota bacterium]